MLTTSCCSVVDGKVSVMVRIMVRVSVSLVSGYSHIFVLLSVFAERDRSAVSHLFSAEINDNQPQQ